MTQQNKRHSLVLPAIIVAIGLIFGGGAAAYAANQFTGADIKDQSLSMADLGPDSVNQSEIRANAVTSSDVKDDSLGLQDIGPATEAALRGGVYEHEFSGNVTNIGGPFAANATAVGTFEVSAGSYEVNTSALFRSNATTSGRADLQVAVRAADGSVWGQDLGTAFTGDSPVQAQREVSAHVTEVVTVPEDTTVTVYVFGYDNAGQGSPDAGLFDASVDVSLEPTVILD